MFWNLQQMTDSIVAQLTGAHQATGKMSLASLLVTFPDTDIAVHGSPLSALLSEGRLIFISTFSEIWKPGLLMPHPAEVVHRHTGLQSKLPSLLWLRKIFGVFGVKIFTFTGDKCAAPCPHSLPVVRLSPPVREVGAAAHGHGEDEQTKHLVM